MCRFWTIARVQILNKVSSAIGIDLFFLRPAISLQKAKNVKGGLGFALAFDPLNISLCLQDL